MTLTTYVHPKRMARRQYTPDGDSHRIVYWELKLPESVGGHNRWIVYLRSDKKQYEFAPFQTNDRGQTLIGERVLVHEKRFFDHLTEVEFVEFLIHHAVQLLSDWE